MLKWLAAGGRALSRQAPFEHYDDLHRQNTAGKRRHDHSSCYSNLKPHGSSRRPADPGPLKAATRGAGYLIDTDLLSAWLGAVTS